MFKQLWTGIDELVYPRHCLLCNTFISASRQNLIQRHPIPLLCEFCYAGIPRNFPPFCVRCSHHFRSPGSFCKKCHAHEHAFDFAWSACLYEQPLNRLIYQFKYGQKTQLRTLFTRLMLEFINKYGLDIFQFDAIIPIPLAAARLRERGYNQSHLLAIGLAQEFQIPLANNLLVRWRYGANQTQLPQKERWTNIQGAFRIKPSNIITNKNILLIDDLLTTGATASEAATCLKNAGANRVGVFTLAIAW